MQAAVSRRSVQASNLIVFPRYMGAQAPIPPEQQPQQNQAGYHPPTHGTWAQWVAPAVALLIGIVSVSLMVHFRNEDTAGKISDEHVNGLINAKLSPAIDKVNDHIDKKVDELGKKIDSLSDGVSHIEGRLDKRVSAVENKVDQQASLAKLIDPNRVLSTIRAEIQMAENDKKPLATSTLSDYKNAIQMFPTTSQYWPVAAQFISYRSRVNVGAAFQALSRPDMPNCTDSLPTPMEYRMTSEEERSTKEETNRVGIDPGRFTPAIYENCRFILDSPEEAHRFPLLGKSFDLEFKNCQIIYNGGPIAIFTPNPRVSLFNGKGPTRGDVFTMSGQQLRFENCLFLFTIKAVPPQEGQQMTHELLAQSGPTLSYGHVSIGG